MTSDVEYDDTPYREQPNIVPVLTVSVKVVDGEPDDAAVWVYVDEEETRVARQRFSSDEYWRAGDYEEWLCHLLKWLRTDPESRDRCGDCGNPRHGSGEYHAPDCAWFGVLGFGPVSA